MRIEGKVHTISNRGEIIARFPSHVSKRSTVLDNRRNKVGKISWVFGPVDAPYVEVSPKKTMKRPLTMIGRPVFVEEDNNE
ncbi:MAG: hypothetical protein R6U17_08410 [Thermoplasmata archaeon]